MLDFLCDSLTVPSLVFINCEITHNGIIPEIGFIGAGKYQAEYDMYDKHRIKCVRLLMPSFLKNGVMLRDQCFYSNNTEFIITEVYL